MNKLSFVIVVLTGFIWTGCAKNKVPAAETSGKRELVQDEEHGDDSVDSDDGETEELDERDELEANDDDPEYVDEGDETEADEFEDFDDGVEDE